MLKAVQAKIEEIIGFAVDDQPLCRLQLDVDQSEFGRVIGPRGSTLQRIEGEAGVVLTVPGQRNPELEHITIGTNMTLHQ